MHEELLWRNLLDSLQPYERKADAALDEYNRAVASAGECRSKYSEAAATKVGLRERIGFFGGERHRARRLREIEEEYDGYAAAANEASARYSGVSGQMEDILSSQMLDESGFRRIPKLWDIGLAGYLGKVAYSLAKYFGLPVEEAVEARVQFTERSMFYAVKGPYRGLPLKGGTRSEATSLLSRTDGRTQIYVFLAPFTGVPPKYVLATTRKMHETGHSLFYGESPKKDFRRFHLCLAAHVINHETGHLFGKFYRALNGIAEPEQSGDPYIVALDESACGFYADEVWPLEKKPADVFRAFPGVPKDAQCDAFSPDSWRRVIQRVGEEPAHKMFLHGDYTRLSGREDLTPALAEELRKFEGYTDAEMMQHIRIQ